MASVFLSYDRDDSDRAPHVAHALEKAGHEVWWDLHVRGGAQFSKVIEEALKAAEVVVVLWSQHSVESAWVRDEATAGRDTGRLVPVTIDGTEPPLGFRQFQTIDLSRWSGRGKPPQLRTLLADVAAATGASQALPAKPQSRAPPVESLQHRGWLIAAVSLGLTIMVLGIAVSRPWQMQHSATPTIAVVAADGSPLSQSMTRDTLATLGSMHGISETSFRLLDSQGDEPADLRVAVSGSQGIGQVQANVSIVSPSQKSVLWSKQFVVPATGANPGRSVAYGAARALSCAMDHFSGKYGRLDGEQLHLYVNACASAPDADDPGTVIPVFRKITENAPRFLPAWVQLLLAELDELNLRRDDVSTTQSVAAAIRQDIAAARKLDPGLAEATVAEIQLLPKSAFLQSLQLVQKAKAQNPDNVATLMEEAELWAKVGRQYDALDDLQRAVALEPFAPGLRAQQILMFAYSGGIDKARDELAKAKQLWPDAPAITGANEAIELRFGDVDKALRASRPVDSGLLAYLNARKNPTEANIDSFVNLAKTHELNRDQRTFVYQAFPELGRSNLLYGYIERWPVEQDLSGGTYILFRPWLKRFRQDPRFLRVAQRLGLLDYWKKSGNWPDFCDEPDMPYDCKTEAAKLT